MPPTGDDDLLTIDEAAARLGLSKWTLYSYRTRNTGPRSHRLPNRELRYRVADLDAWRAEQEAATTRGGAA